MARPSRCRRVCAEPECSGFAPRQETGAGETVLTVDEFEAIRLIDYEKKTHEECAAQMDISRTTATEIYESARFKLSDSLVNGKALVIAGGHYRVCQGDRECGCGPRCRRRKQEDQESRKKGGVCMRIAVPYENGLVFQHFGHTGQVKLYDVEEDQIVDQQLADTTGSGHGALVGFLVGQRVDVLICGGIGGGAQEALTQAGIKLYGGVAGKADDAVKAFLTGTLSYSADARCGHHDHGHACSGQHGHCGEDKHGCAGNGGHCAG